MKKRTRGNIFVRRFEAVAKAHPNAVAILTDGCEELTYRQLYENAHALSHTLKEQGAAEGRLIALSIDKSAEYVMALLACWMAGAAFMPVDACLPKARHDHMLKQARPRLWVQGKTLSITKLKKGTAYSPELAYIIYTSGSSGAPKGVMVPHAGIVHFLDAQIKVFQLKPGSRSLLYLSTGFDASVSDMGTALLSGATLCIETGDRLATALRLADILRERRITHLDIPPSLLSLLDIRHMPSTLEAILIGGETCPVDTVRQWSGKYRLVNIYGPTEATVCTSMARCTPEWSAHSIGRPIPHMRYRLIGGSGNKVSAGEAGELCISGKGLALGYVNNPGLTREKFIFRGKTRYYRTGDWVRQNAQGEYIYIGRMDRQVKIHGQLAAPEEIESALMTHPAVEKAAIIVKESGNARRLIAYVKSTGTVTPAVLKQHLRHILPSWMLPHAIIPLNAFPHTANGKIDYQSLQGRALLSSAAREEERTDDPIARKLQRIWQIVLKLPCLPGPDRDFFDDLGGDSMAALAMVLEAQAHGLDFPIGILGNLRTIADLAAWLKQARAAFASDGLPAGALREDAAITPEWNKTFQATSALPPAPRDAGILITGCTGLLGIHVLAECLAQTDRHVFCLVKADDAAHGLSRITKAARHYGLHLTQARLARITVITADMSQPQLGLSDRDWKRLASRASDIYHCGGAVNMVASYEELKPVNVTATQEIARLACTRVAKKIHFASSLSVFVATDRNTGTCYENDTLEGTRLVYGGYAQSKWAAEYFLRHIPQGGPKVNIFRLGLLTANSLTGRFSPRDYLALFIRGLLSLRAIPGGDWSKFELDVTPVDYAAKAMVYASLRPEHSCYHVAGSSRLSLRAIADALGRRNRSLRKLSRSEWSRIRPRDEAAIAAYTALCRLLPQSRDFARYRAMDLFQATDVSFDQSRLRHALRNSAIVCPQAGEALLDAYIAGITDGIETGA